MYSPTAVTAGTASNISGLCPPRLRLWSDESRPALYRMCFHEDGISETKTEFARFFSCTQGVSFELNGCFCGKISGTPACALALEQCAAVNLRGTALGPAAPTSVGTDETQGAAMGIIIFSALTQLPPEGGRRIHQFGFYCAVDFYLCGKLEGVFFFWGKTPFLFLQKKKMGFRTEPRRRRWQV